MYVKLGDLEAKEEGRSRRKSQSRIGKGCELCRGHKETTLFLRRKILPPPSSLTLLSFPSATVLASAIYVRDLRRRIILPCDLRGQARGHTGAIYESGLSGARRTIDAAHLPCTRNFARGAYACTHAGKPRAV